MNRRPNRNRTRRDYGLFGAVGLLLFIGLLVIYTISPVLNYGAFQSTEANYFLYRHLAHVCLGLVAFFVASRLSLDVWRRLLPLLVWASVISSILLLIPATNQTFNGATRWVGLGPITYQPAELLKLTIVLYMGFLFGARHKSELDDPQITLWPTMWMLGILGILLVIIQRDLGTMVVVAAIIMGLLYFAGVQLRQLSIATSILGGAAFLAIILFPHRMSRLTTFLNAGEDVQGAGYHIDQALTAIGSGGLTGVGLGQSIQVFGFLPEAENDSVFAIYSEMFGFIGAVGVLVIFGYLLFKILQIAQNQRDTSARLIVSGFFLWIASHVIINVGAMLSLMPLTGLTLPFLSYGGSSLLMMMTGLGIVFGLSGNHDSGIQRSRIGRR